MKRAYRGGHRRGRIDLRIPLFDGSSRSSTRFRHAHRSRRPDLVRGGSQSGNIAVRDLLAARLVEILASDYVPRSMLDAAFMISADPGLDYDLPSAVAMVTRNPALAGNLPDRGAIATGLKADLIRVDLQDGQPFVKSAWRSGNRVA